jgi:dolichyl-phosphate beta-glucosyltransferase
MPLSHASSLKPAFAVRALGSLPATADAETPYLTTDTSGPAARPPRSPLRFSALAATDHELTVIIPAYNEENRLPKSLATLGRFLDATQLDYRVTVADDGSRDRTPQLADECGRRFSTVRLPQNGGKGRAVRAAMLAATGQVVAFTDADLPFDLSALVQGYEWIRQHQCEVAFGSRQAGKQAHVAQRQFMRKVATRAFRGVVQLLVATDITDTQCGLKLFSRRAAVEIFSQATIDGFAFDTEVVLLARRLGLSNRALPVTLINEEMSTVSLTRHALPMLLDVLKIRARLGHRHLAPQLPVGWGRLMSDRPLAA